MVDKDKTKKDVVTENLRELLLSDNANDLDFQPHPASKTEVRLGFKSTDRLDQIQKERLPQQVVDIPQFIADMARLTYSIGKSSY
jgi:hypothetical protein